MPIARFQMPDGRIARFEVPEGTTPEQAQAMIAQAMPKTDQAPAGAQENMGQAALIAAGRGTDKIVKGVRQAYNYVTGDDETLAQMAEQEGENDRLYKPLQEKFPFTTAVAETAPMFAIPGGGTLKGAMAIGAAPGLLGYGSVEDRLKRGGTGAIGGGIGHYGGQLIARALKPAGVGAVGVSDDAMAAAARTGFKPTAGQQTQNAAMLNFENYLAKSPGSSGKMQGINQANQSALNRTAAKAMGETADTLDEGVFGAATQRIGGEFDRLGQVTKPDLTGGFLNTLAKIDSDNAARGAFASPKIRSLVDKGLDLASKNNLDGKAYKEIRTALANEAQSAFKSGDATVGQALKQMVSSLDDAAKGSLSAADQKAWDVARKEWGAFKTLSKSNIAEGGNVSAARTAAALRAQGPNFRAGKSASELADIGRVGEAFKGALNPNSGTLNQNMLYGNPITGLPMMAGNSLAASAYMSPLMQRYLAQGLIDVGPTGELLLGRASGQASIPAVRGLLGVE